jgi:DNA-directed RNA polymerase subunit K/omega
MGRIKLDLHDIYNNSKAVDQALQEAFDNAINKKIKDQNLLKD